MKSTQQRQKYLTYFTRTDFKLIAKSEEELLKQIQTVKTFSDDVYMEYWLDKCAKITFKEAN